MFTKKTLLSLLNSFVYFFSLNQSRNKIHKYIRSVKIFFISTIVKYFFILLNFYPLTIPIVLFFIENFAKNPTYFALFYKKREKMVERDLNKLAIGVKLVEENAQKLKDLSPLSPAHLLRLCHCTWACRSGMPSERESLAVCLSVCLVKKSGQSGLLLLSFRLSLSLSQYLWDVEKNFEFLHAATILMLVCAPRESLETVSWCWLEKYQVFFSFFFFRENLNGASWQNIISYFSLSFFFLQIEQQTTPKKLIE